MALYRWVSIGLITFIFSGSAWAQELVYKPVNPSFGGDSFNSSHLLAIANAQNDYERPQEEASSQDELDRFIRSLQSRLLSSLSTQVANAIFGENAQDSGTIVFGGQTVEFVRTLEGIELTITNEDGSQTVITIPTLVTNDGTDGSSDSEDSTPSTSSIDTSGSSKISSPTLLSTGPLASGPEIFNRENLLAREPTLDGESLSEQSIH